MAERREQEDGERSKNLLNVSFQYISMIDLLLDSKKFKDHYLYYHLPAYNTLSMAVEIFLKAIHAQHGATDSDLRNVFSHNIKELWCELPSEFLKSQILRAGKRTEAWLLQTQTRPPKTRKAHSFEEHFNLLSRLHDQKGSQFRYPTKSFDAPSFIWLGESFASLITHYHQNSQNPRLADAGQYWLEEY